MEHTEGSRKDFAREVLLWSVCLCALLPVPLFFTCVAPYLGLGVNSGGWQQLAIAALMVQMIWPPVGLAYLLIRERRAGRPRWFWKCARAQVALWGYVAFLGIVVLAQVASMMPYWLPGEQQRNIKTKALWVAVYDYAIRYHGQWPVNLQDLVRHKMLKPKDLFLLRSKNFKFRAVNGDWDFGYCRPDKQFIRWTRLHKDLPITHQWLVLWTKVPFYRDDYMGVFMYGLSQRDEKFPGPVLRMDGYYIYGALILFDKSDLLKALGRQDCQIEGK